MMRKLHLRIELMDDTLEAKHREQSGGERWRKMRRQTDLEDSWQTGSLT